MRHCPGVLWLNPLMNVGVSCMNRDWQRFSLSNFLRFAQVLGLPESSEPKRDQMRSPRVKRFSSNIRLDNTRRAF